MNTIVNNIKQRLSLWEAAMGRKLSVGRTMRMDIEKQYAYVLQENGVIIAYIAVVFDGDRLTIQ